MKFTRAKKFLPLSNNQNSIKYLTIYFLPINIVGALYLGGIYKFIYLGLKSTPLGIENLSIIEILKLLIENIEIYSLGILMLLIAGTLNIISPLKIPNTGPPIVTTYETATFFVILFVLNIVWLKKIDEPTSCS